MKYEIYLQSGTVVRFEDHTNAGGLSADFESFDTGSGTNPIRAYNGQNSSRLVVDLRQIEAVHTMRN
ncbi:MAG: hypothetical protein ACKVYV_13100 [Limisphaerales bacterium]